ncbi:MAG: RNA degradosome polyphosphate kinase [Pseudomonadota bacterium]
MNAADFINSKPPKGVKIAEVTGEAPTRYLNRELSWLAFNWRVLEMAQDKSWPLLERLRMLSISSSNLDEFFTVRVAGLRELDRNGVTSPALDGLSPAEQLDLINLDAGRLMAEQQAVYRELKKELSKSGIEIVSAADMSAQDRERAQQLFQDDVFPIVSPLAVDPAHPFPFIPSGSLSMALHLQGAKKTRDLLVLVPIPNILDRFVQLAAPKGTLRLLPLEEIILNALPTLFPNHKLAGRAMFRVLRDADLEIEDEAEDLVDEFETALKRRVRGDAVRLKISADAPPSLRGMIVTALGVSKKEVFEIDGILGLNDLTEICAAGPKDMAWPKYTPRAPERVEDFGGDIFAAIKQKDMLLHHPYESFDYVVQFVSQAARDPNVVAIKQTLYRTSNQSPIVSALCAAAEAGKQVTALVELKARFDEAANIRLARQMEKAGVHVVYGFIDLKTHAKIATVVRREGKDLVTYTHFGTGNYHPVTANIYTDLSYFTSSKPLGRDATRVFNYLSGYADVGKLEKMAIAPIDMKSELIRYIRAEAENAKQGKPAQIWAKMNSLIEGEVIDALYEAAQAGVKIDLVVRGICGLRPGVKGLSENIRVKSVVGRFLEHSRIVCFGNGHLLPSNHAHVFMSSADWMGRNLHGRVETLVRISNKTVHAQIVSQIMAANMADTQNSWVLQPDGSYIREAPAQNAFDCHRFFMENPSLSGRGKTGAKDVPELTHSYDD